MSRLCVAWFVVAVALFAGSAAGQEKKDTPAKDSSARAKGFLPQNWGRIGLSDEQKQDIYKVQAKYNDEIDKLEAKIREMKAARQKDMEKVLTADQKKKLLDILTGKAGVEK